MANKDKDLFQHSLQLQIEQESPLAHRMRPRTLAEFVGQEHIVGPGRLLRRAIEADQLSSLILYGPPGTGKTTLAMVIANTTRSDFATLNAVLAGVKQLREVIATAADHRALYGRRTTLFVDEVHRWNKAQQDALLPHVENGTVILIGATTENPYFEVNRALVSRSRIFQLKPLTADHLRQIVQQTLADAERGYGQLKVDLHANALDHLVDVANGDARAVLNALELAVETTAPDESGPIVVDLAVAEESIQRRAVLYDKDGDTHFDTVSAFIKSLRGSDADAALYWMAKMIYAGEDPRFIFRRMAILASEDVGLADPNAVTVVNSCWALFERIGLPEGRFPLAQAALYLATCPKSNTTLSFFDALATVEKEGESEVPNHLRDANRDAKGFGHGQGYLYPHAYRDHWVAQQYLPTGLQGKLFYQPGDRGYERQIRDDVARRREAQLAAMLETIGDAPGEVLTTGPTDRVKEAWLQRVVANSGRTLAQVRRRLFELAAIQRHYLVLDLQAGSGLLTWEAIRLAPEGRVYALAREMENAEALRQQAERLPELERPVVLAGEPEELDYLLSLRSEEDIRFDRILGRNVLTHFSQRASDMLAGLGRRLASDGRLCLAQVVPRHGQRLYWLIDWSDLPDELAEKVKTAEEAIYLDGDDPLVNWDEREIASASEAAGFVNVQVRLEDQVEQQVLGEQHFDRWFVRRADDNRGTYLDRLLAGGLTEAEAETVATAYRRQLLGRQVDWQRTHLFLVARPG